MPPIAEIKQNRASNINPKCDCNWTEI